jgi:endonuclease YncB( thermonuclease family)
MSSIIQMIYTYFCFSSKKKELLRLQEKLNKIQEPRIIPYFNFKGKYFFARPCQIYDGDTFSILFEFHGEIIKYRCRCLGYDTAEMKPPLSHVNREHEIELAHKAKERFTELLLKHKTQLVEVECFEFDKYGRILVRIWNHVDKECINDIMIQEGYGKPYNGGTKEKW